MLKKKFKPHIGVLSIILIAVCGALIAADLLTKHFEEVFNWQFAIIPGFVEISGNIRNQGCAFSFLNNNPEVGQPLLISLTSVMLAFLLFIFVFLPERFKLLKVTVAIVIAGAIGNLVDRCMFREVRDFIGLNMMFSTKHLVYCNLADFYIVIGAALVVVDLLFLNDWAVFPLTKQAKAAQAKRKEEEKNKEKEKEKEAAHQATITDLSEIPESTDNNDGEIQ